MAITKISYTQEAYSFPEQNLRPHYVPDELKVRRIIGWQCQATAASGDSGILHLPNGSESLPTITLGKRSLVDRIDLVANVLSSSGPVNHAVMFNVWTSITGGTPNLARLVAQPLNAACNPGSANTYLESRRSVYQRTEDNLWLPCSPTTPLNLSIEFPEVSGGGVSVWWNGMIFCWSEV